MAAGDIWEVGIPHYNEATDPPNQCRVATWHFQQLSVAGTADDLQQLVKEAWDVFVTPMGDKVYVPGVHLTKVFPTESGQISFKWDPELRGVGDVALHPKSTGLYVQRNTGLMGRKHRGHYWHPWIPIGWNHTTDPDQISGTAGANLSSSLTAFALTVAGGGSTGTEWIPVVFSHRAADDVVVGTPIISYSVKSVYRVLSRAARRVEPCPPFVESPLGDHVATTSGGLFQGDPPALVDDGGQWAGISSEDPDIDAILTGQAYHFSEPEYDDSEWNHALYATVVGFQTVDACDHNPTYDWPDLIFHRGTYGFPFAETFWCSRQDVGDSHSSSGAFNNAGDVSYLRRVWEVDDREIAIATIRHVGDDYRHVWINGYQVFAEPAITYPAFTYGSSTEQDVTSYIRRGALNCLALVGHHGAGGGNNTRPGTCHLIPTAETRHAFVGAELRIWFA